MGLDMYLEDAHGNEIGYWRKANQIHNWFVQNVQNGVDDCDRYPVSREKMKELLGICESIIEKARVVDGKVVNGQSFENGKWINHYEDGRIIENADEIAAILPTHSGFFFGGTGYDQYYIYDIEHTIEVLKKTTSDDVFTGSEYYYQSSW